MKDPTLLSVDSQLKKEAQERGWVLSEVFEDALKQKLQYKEIKLDKVCFFCKMEKDQLSWLYPDERWICDKCFKGKTRAKINSLLKNLT